MTDIPTIKKALEEIGWPWNEMEAANQAHLFYTAFTSFAFKEEFINFIIKSPKTISFLVSEVERLEKEIKEVRQELFTCICQEEEMVIKLKDENANLNADNAVMREGLEGIKKHGCCVMHNDTGCPGCIATKTLKKIGAL